MPLRSLSHDPFPVTGDLMSDTAALPTLGVIIVTYRSSDVVVPCLESLLNSHYPHIKIVVCDNASADNTVGVIRDWARGVADVEPSLERQSAHSGALPRRIQFGEFTAPDGEPGSADELPTVTLVHSGLNRGYAGGVNVGLKVLQRYPEIGLFWILNPDCVVMPETATAFVEAARKNPGFGLMGGRVKYFGQEEQIQSDGGRVHPWTGICANIGLGQPAEGTLPPNPSQIQFVSGASLVASREFLTRAGLMAEDYFLYYEEVDWALRRGDLPIVYAEGAVVRHRVGTSIGSATLKTAPSAFANYFNYRNRIRFIRRFFPSHLPVAYGYSALKIAKLAARGAREEALAAFCGLFNLPPPLSVRSRLSPDAAALAFPSRRTRSIITTEPA